MCVSSKPKPCHTVLVSELQLISKVAKAKKIGEQELHLNVSQCLTPVSTVTSFLYQSLQWAWIAFATVIREIK